MNTQPEDKTEESKEEWKYGKDMKLTSPDLIGSITVLKAAHPDIQVWDSYDEEDDYGEELVCFHLICDDDSIVSETERLNVSNFIRLNDEVFDSSNTSTFGVLRLDV